MIEVDVAAYRNDFVDGGALAVAFDTSVPLRGFQLYTPMNVVLLANGKAKFSVGPTTHQVAVHLHKTVVTMIFYVPVDDFIPVAKTRGEHVQIEGHSLATRITGVQLPCNVPAFKLFFEGGVNDEAASKPSFRAVEISH